ncbi:TPA: DNA primase [Candidatus Beckwithbacteria bacterium]|nr:DNA primase [Candidatus Beckwithbacteria bacterium]
MDQVEQVRQKTDIVEIISEAVPLKKAGRNFKALCPFHEEKTPSFMVNPERQIFKCFGCGIGGDVYKFVMEREKIDFGEVLRMLADRAGVELVSYRPSEEQKKKERLFEVNHLASEYYHYLLTEHKVGKKALEYLLKRGVAKASIRLFKLGFAPEEWAGLKNFLVKKKGYKVEELEAAGLAIKGERGYYDRFRGRVVFALFDHRGRVVGFAGRTLDPDAREAKYVNTPETPLYHKSNVLYGLETTKDEIKKKNQAVVVEGELDMISSYQAGVKNAVAIKGTALTAEQVELLSRFTENLALALDEDAAGDQAARRGIELAEQAGLNVRVIKLKYGKDPDECVQKDARLWPESVKEAVPIYDFYIASAVKRYGVDTPEGKRKVSEEVVEVLAGVTNQVIKNHYVKKLAEKLGVTEEAVTMEVDKSRSTTSSRDRGSTADKPGAEKFVDSAGGKSREERLAEYTLALVLNIDAEVEALVKQVDEKALPEGAVKKVIEKLKAWFKAKKKWEVNKFVRSLPEELTAAVDRAYLTEVDRAERDIDKLELELSRAMAELTKSRLKGKLNRLSERIKQVEAEGKKNTLNKLKQEFVETAKRLKVVG